MAVWALKSVICVRPRAYACYSIQAIGDLCQCVGGDETRGWTNIAKHNHLKPLTLPSRMVYSIHNCFLYPSSSTHCAICLRAPNRTWHCWEFDGTKTQFHCESRLGNGIIVSSNIPVAKPLACRYSCYKVPVHASGWIWLYPQLTVFLAMPISPNISRKCGIVATCQSNTKNTDTGQVLLKNSYWITPKSVACVVGFSLHFLHMCLRLVSVRKDVCDLVWEDADNHSWITWVPFIPVWQWTSLLNMSPVAWLWMSFTRCDCYSPNVIIVDTLQAVLPR
jgi:hypothetical protein